MKENRFDQLLLDEYDKYIIASKTDVNGIITYVSKAFCNICGYSENELIGAPQNLIRHPDMPKEVFKELWNTIESGKTWHGEIKNLRKNGTHYWVKAHVSPEYNGKKIVGYLAIREDITDKKMYESLSLNLENEVKKRTAQIRKYTKYLDTIFDANPNIVIVTEGKHIERVNTRFLEFNGYESLTHFKNDYDCICDRFEIKEGYLQAIMPNGEVWIDYVYNNPAFTHKAIIKKSGIEYIFSIKAEKITIDGTTRFIAILTDITELEDALILDPLTKLLNRRRIDDILTSCKKNFKSREYVLSVVIMDIDDFKTVNDTFGHDVGDSVLVELAMILRKFTNEETFIGRWGGEEFIIIMKNIPLEQAKVITQQILDTIRDYKFSYVEKITASFGLASLQLGEGLRDLIKRADDNLYTAKNSGKNRLVC